MAKKAVVPESEKKIKTLITVSIYEPVEGDVKTHKPQVSFEGEILSRKALEDVHFHMVKALALYKVEKGKSEKKNGETEMKEEGDV